MDPPVIVGSGRLRWHVLPEWESRLFGPDGLRLAEWQDQGRVEVIKQGAHRTVYHVRLPEGAVYVKHRRPNRVADVVQHLVRASVARREWAKALELRRRNIPAVTPLAWQEHVRAGLVWESWLVTEAVDGVCSLEEFFHERLPDVPATRHPSIRRRVIRSLARFTASMHQAGVMHDDFHAGNILLGPEPCTSHTGDANVNVDASWPIYLVDVPGVRFFRSPLDWRASRAGLIVLNSGWWERIGRSERLRFWQTYCDERPDLDIPARRPALKQLELDTRRHACRVARRRDRRALATNRDYTVLRANGREAHGVGELTEPELARLLHDPESLLWQNLSSPVKLGHGCQAVRAELSFGDRKVSVLYKRYRPRNGLKAIAARWRRGRAVQSWHGGHALVLRGIRTARPVAVCQIRRGTLCGHGYLATEWIEGAENLHLYLRRLTELPESERIGRARRCAESLGSLIGRMHAWKISHGDLKASNLLVVETQEGPDAHGLDTYVIDTDDIRIGKRLSPRLQIADLARLATSMRAHPWISRSVACRFFRAYRGQFSTSETDWKRLWCRVRKHVGRLSQRKERRGEPIL